MSDESTVRPPTVQEVLENMQSEWDALQTALSGLDAAKMTTSAGGDGWSVKDELAHLAAWARGLAALVRKQPRYTPMGLPADAAPIRSVSKA